MYKTVMSTTEAVVPWNESALEQHVTPTKRAAQTRSVKMILLPNKKGAEEHASEE
jgi:hypothetical protein